MRKPVFILIFLAGGLLAACNEQKSPRSETINITDGKPIKKIIIDVRSKEEWLNDGHADCSVNFPLDELHLHTDTLKNFDQIEVVCKSGGRAASAQELLESMGFSKVENKGSWQNISCP